MTEDFKDLGIDEPMIGALKKQGILEPTQIQKLVLPVFLQGKDLIAQSQTGSGKTLAYLLPAISRIDPSLRSTQVLVLAPTHELASQIFKQTELLCSNGGAQWLRCALIIGGANLTRQLERLKEKPQIVIGSAGRILELIQKKKITAHTIKTIVTDEADRMLDDFNLNGLKSVIKTTLRDRQLVFFSASFSGIARERAEQLMKEPLFLIAAEERRMPSGITHGYIEAQQREKFLVLRKLLRGDTVKKAIVFINNTENIEVITDKLNYHKIDAAGVFGASNQTLRREAVSAFANGHIQVLVSSDLSARGLDFKEVSHIINLDIPEEPTFYLHRAGRTGRAGEAGKCISIVTEYEKRWLKKYEKEYGITILPMEMSGGILKKQRQERPADHCTATAKKNTNQKNTLLKKKSKKK